MNLGFRPHRSFFSRAKLYKDRPIYSYRPTFTFKRHAIVCIGRQKETRKEEKKTEEKRCECAVADPVGDKMKNRESAV